MASARRNLILSLQMVLFNMDDMAGTLRFEFEVRGSNSRFSADAYRGQLEKAVRDDRENATMPSLVVAITNGNVVEMPSGRMHFEDPVSSAAVASPSDHSGDQHVRSNAPSAQLRPHTKSSSCSMINQEL